MKVSPIQTNFTGGIFSPYMDGHIDSPRRNNSYKNSINLIPMIQGPLTRRGGTRFVSELKSSSLPAWLQSFEFNVEQAYQIEWGDLYMRFYKDHGQILDGVSPYEIATPYPQVDLFDSDGLFVPQTAQSADVLYIAHDGYKPRALTRSGDINWALTELWFEDGPYLPTNRTETTLTCSAGTGFVTVTASAVTGINDDQGFLATDVGRLIRIRQNSGSPAVSGWHWGYISAYTSPTVVTMGVQETSFTPSATAEWRLGLYSDTTGYPSAVGLYDGRLVFAFSPGNRTRVDFSTVGGFSPTTVRFSPSDTDATVNPDNAISITISTTNYGRWLAGDEKGLVVGTAGGEFMIRPSTLGEALTPNNATAKPTSREGCARIQPIETGSTILFAQRYRRKINEHAYNFEVDSYRAPDMTILSNQILRTGVSALAWQAQPNRLLWCACADGGLRALTYQREEEVIAWSDHELGGYAGIAGTQKAVVESVSVIPAPDASGDEVWMIVRRYIDGQVKRYIEWMTPIYDDISMTVDDAFHVDCGLTYDGAPASVISGLDHLEGQEVAVMVDGMSHPRLTVSGGSITLANGVEGSKVHVGLANRWLLRTHKWEGGARDGTAQGKIKRFSHVIVRLLNTLGFKYGINEVDEYDFDNADEFDQEAGLFTGDIRLPWPDGYDRAGEQEFGDDDVFPVTIQALMPRMRTQDG